MSTFESVPTSSLKAVIFWEFPFPLIQFHYLAPMVITVKMTRSNITYDSLIVVTY